MSKIEIYNQALELQGEIDRVISSKKTERINSDYTLDFQTFLTADVISLISGDGKTIRMARSIGRPIRYFIAKREAGPSLVD